MPAGRLTDPTTNPYATQAQSSHHHHPHHQRQSEADPTVMSYQPAPLPKHFPISIPLAPPAAPAAPNPPKPNAFFCPVLPVYPLPHLPPIKDAEILKKIFTHTSLLTRQNRALLQEGIGAGKERIGKGFEDKIDRVTMDYEKLEHVGDSILGMIITTWLHEIKPRLTIGTATKLKSLLVSNPTLSHLSTLYSLPARLMGDPIVLPIVRAQPDVRAALFEGYIAGVYYSHPLPTRGVEAWKVLDPWLREVYAPYMEFFYTAMKNEYMAAVYASNLGPNGEDTSAIDKAADGMAALIQMWAAKNKVSILFTEEKVDLHTIRAGGGGSRVKAEVKEEDQDGIKVIKTEQGFPNGGKGENIEISDSDIESESEIEEIKSGPKLSKITATMIHPNGGSVVKTCVRMNRKIAKNVAAYEVALELGIAT